MKKIGSIIERREQSVDKYVSREFQQYGYDLSVELSDPSHKALYIKLAKTHKREHLEAARRFVSDANNAKSPAKLFMWKLKQLSNNASKKLEG
jgi:hypothetical protein